MTYEVAISQIAAILRPNTPASDHEAEKLAHHLLATQAFAKRDRGRLLSYIGELIDASCRHVEAIELHQEGLSLVSEDADRLAILCGLAYSAQLVGDLVLCRHTAVDLKRTLSISGGILEAAWAWGYLGRLLASLGELSESLECANRGLSVATEFGQGVPEALYSLGCAEEANGNLETATALYADAASRTSGSCRTDSLRELIRVKTRLGHHREASRIMRDTVDGLSTECMRSVEGLLRVLVPIGKWDAEQCVALMEKLLDHITRLRG